MLVARPSVKGLEINDDRPIITRLGEGVARTGRLSAAAIERTLAALAEHRRYAESVGAQLTAVTTEGVRLAENPDDFLTPAASVLGVPVRLVSGDEEARLSYLSVLDGPLLDSEQDRPLWVLDIGGGSTELIAGRGRAVLSAVSHKIGSVRLTEQHLADYQRRGGPAPRAAVEAIAGAARAAFATQLPPSGPRSDELHGLAGTVTTAAALMLGLEQYERARVDGARFPLAAVVALRERLAALPLEELRALPCDALADGRADVIVAGVTILQCAMEHCGVSTLVCRDRGLRYALARVDLVDQSRDPVRIARP